jgi:hypothetical protein
MSQPDMDEYVWQTDDGKWVFQMPSMSLSEGPYDSRLEAIEALDAWMEAW